MSYLIILFAEIGILFLLSKSMSKSLSRFLSINLLSFVFLPGVIIHELSHFLSATIMFVPVGEMEFAPKKVGDKLKLGSIEIGRTDPIRRSIIGAFPVFVGLAVVIGIVYFFTSNIIFLQSQSYYVLIASIIGTIYLLFAISNTMFSSSKDMEGTVEILIALLVIFAVAYYLGFRPQLNFVNHILTSEILEALKRASIFLLAPITIDLFLLGIIRIIYKRQ